MKKNTAQLRNNLPLTFPSTTDPEQKEAKHSLHVAFYNCRDQAEPCVLISLTLDVMSRAWLRLNLPTQHPSDWQCPGGNVKTLLGSIFC